MNAKKMNDLQIGSAIKVSGVTIIPVEQINISSEIRPTTLWWYGSKQVYALVICTTYGILAIDQTAREIPIDKLFAELPQLENIISQCENR